MECGTAINDDAKLCGSCGTPTAVTTEAQTGGFKFEVQPPVLMPYSASSCQRILQTAI